jgi:sugar/nucleoside kinase (ribokinase family)
MFSIDHGELPAAGLRLMVVGATYLDEIIYTSDRLGLDSSVSLRARTHCIGGPGFCWAMALRRWQPNVAFVTVLGTCKQSRNALHQMHQAKLEVYSQIEQKSSLDHALVIVDEYNSKLAITNRCISPLLQWTPDLAAVAQNMDAVVLTSALQIEQIKAIISSLPPKTFLVLAPNKQMCKEMSHAPCRDYLRRVNYLTLNAEEFEVLGGASEVPLITLTQGMEGGIITVDGRSQRFLPRPMSIERPVNTNGAGEVFGAAFLSALLSGYDPLRSVEQAALHAYHFLTTSPEHYFAQMPTEVEAY